MGLKWPQLQNFMKAARVAPGHAAHVPGLETEVDSAGGRENQRCRVLTHPVPLPTRLPSEHVADAGPATGGVSSPALGWPRMGFNLGTIR